MLGIEAKEALQADADLWPALKANFHLMHAKAFEQGYLAGRARFDPIRTENETLRAEIAKVGPATNDTRPARFSANGLPLTWEPDSPIYESPQQVYDRGIAAALAKFPLGPPLLKTVADKNAQIETLRAERDAAIARAEEQANRIAQMERWLGLTGDPALRPTIEASHELAAQFDDRFRARVRENFALTTPEHPHGV
ncbi:hypothetical protein ASF34_01510 [Methylobacterium sp. Leaf106]|nr:hypothetical protein ASF34_01510 [Methylobacterium sp. Leaf106]